MGQEVSVMCPVCKSKKATYKDVFEAEGMWPLNIPKMFEPKKMFRDLNIRSYVQKEDFRLPPFERFLGPDCLKYIYDENPSHKKQENISYWLFYSCEDCIDVGDSNRRDKFYIHNPDGVTIWRSQLP